ncbi:LysR family transcriptional regulator [Oceanobacillus piezotolerans]|uniref:LysR family transcriptional regulator n=1 Tax=Oceanobacillus piezotolerans TaxID=2448030 RepID=A0A498D827_9BACI|nr:LysR family transcriptional regulator [Oceanobacillus piezotolerans]RLL46676.1 LysR family transcriptional regulator [Oceanobacillus piezotolerans]
MDQHLIVFMKVAQLKNFSRAAEELHMSQPAVSQYIQALERELGVKLLERTNKYVEVNKAGKIVYQYGKSILREYEQMQTLVSDLQNEPAGELRIGASYTIGEYLLPSFLALLQKDYSAIIPSVSIGNTEDIGSKLVSHDIDIGLVEGTFTHKQVISVPFQIDRLYIISSIGKSLLKKRITPEVLAAETWIIREEGSGTRKVVEEFFEKHHISPNRLITLGSTQTIKEGVEAGLGISLLSELTIQKEIELDRIRRLEFAGTPIQRAFYVMKNHHEFYPKALQVFENLVRRSQNSD